MQRITIALLLCGFLAIILNLRAQKAGDSGTDPRRDGYVPNAETAIKIAEAIWLPVYGDKINDNRPFKAVLRDSVIWVVQGTLHSEKGGVPYAEIQKKDCMIIKVTHSK